MLSSGQLFRGTGKLLVSSCSIFDGCWRLNDYHQHIVHTGCLWQLDRVFTKEARKTDRGDWAFIPIFGTRMLCLWNWMQWVQLIAGQPFEGCGTFGNNHFCRTSFSPSSAVLHHLLYWLDGWYWSNCLQRSFYCSWTHSRSFTIGFLREKIRLAYLLN